MASAILALGANIGDPAKQIEAAMTAIATHPAITLVKRSTIIETPPWGNTEQDPFLNGAVLIDTDLAPMDLLDFCLETETALGRVRAEKWGPRVIDIDIVAYNRIIMETKQLTLPHPYAHERDFVLIPVREIAPEIADWLLIRATKTSA